MAFRLVRSSSPERLLRRESAIELYTFATAHTLFQGAELEKVLPELVFRSKSGRITIIDEGIFGPIPICPEYELQAEDLRFTIRKYMTNEGKNVIFGDDANLCAIESVAQSKPLKDRIATLRSRQILCTALEALEKDTSVPTLIVAGITHIAQIETILCKEGADFFAANEIADVIIRSRTDIASYKASLRGLEMMRELARKPPISPEEIARQLGR